MKNWVGTVFQAGGIAYIKVPGLERVWYNCRTRRKTGVPVGRWEKDVKGWRGIRDRQASPMGPVRNLAFILKALRSHASILWREMVEGKVCKEGSAGSYLILKRSLVHVCSDLMPVFAYYGPQIATKPSLSCITKGVLFLNHLHSFIPSNWRKKKNQQKRTFTNLGRYL